MNKSLAIEKDDQYMDKNKQGIIKSFKQNHLIAAYFGLEEEVKRQHLLASMEMIQFDLLDLVTCSMTPRSITTK